MKVASTREMIEKLQEYERTNDVGAIVCIATVCNGDRKVEYRVEIANDSDMNRVFKKDGNYKEKVVEISSIDDDELFLPKKDAFSEGENNMRRITDSELLDLPFGSKIKIIWHNSKRHKKNERYRGIVFGDMIGWEDGLSDTLRIIAESMYNEWCMVYLFT